MTFEEAWASRVQGHYGSQPVNFLGLQRLIQAKERAGRPQDLADLDWLRKIKGER